MQLSFVTGITVYFNTRISHTKNLVTKFFLQSFQLLFKMKYFGFVVFFYVQNIVFAKMWKIKPHTYRYKKDLRHIINPNVLYLKIQSYIP